MNFGAIERRDDTLLTCLVHRNADFLVPEGLSVATLPLKETAPKCVPHISPFSCLHGCSPYTSFVLAQLG